MAPATAQNKMSDTRITRSMVSKAKQRRRTEKLKKEISCTIQNLTDSLRHTLKLIKTDLIVYECLPSNHFWKHGNMNGVVVRHRMEYDVYSRHTRPQMVFFIFKMARRMCLSIKCIVAAVNYMDRYHTMTRYNPKLCNEKQIIAIVALYIAYKVEDTDDFGEDDKDIRTLKRFIWICCDGYTSEKLTESTKSIEWFLMKYLNFRMLISNPVDIADDMLAKRVDDYSGTYSPLLMCYESDDIRCLTMTILHCGRLSATFSERSAYIQACAAVSLASYMLGKRQILLPGDAMLRLCGIYTIVDLAKIWQERCKISISLCKFDETKIVQPIQTTDDVEFLRNRILDAKQIVV